MFKISEAEDHLATVIEGVYNGKEFTIIHYDDESYHIVGDFTEQEKESIIKAYFNTLF